MCRFHQTSIIHICTDNNAARIQVIVESLRFTQELWAEDDIIAVELFTNRCSVTNRDGTLDNHNGFRVILNHQFDDRFDCACVKEILLTIVICRCSNDHEICIGVCFFCIQSCSQIQLFFCQIFLNVFVLNLRLLIVNHLHFIRNNIHCSHLVVLR